MWLIFGSRGGWAVGFAFVRRVQKLPLVRWKPVSASSKRDPLLAWTEPMSDGGCTSEKTNLRQGTNAAKQQLKERDVRKMQTETALQTPRLVQKEGRRFSRHRAEACANPKGVVNWGTGCPFIAHGHHTRQISMCSHGGAHGAAVDEACRELCP